MSKTKILLGVTKEDKRNNVKVKEKLTESREKFAK
jgi:hypothetical protein